MCIQHRCVDIASLNITSCGHCNNHGVSAIHIALLGIAQGSEGSKDSLLSLIEHFVFVFILHSLCKFCVFVFCIFCCVAILMDVWSFRYHFEINTRLCVISPSVFRQYVLFRTAVDAQFLGIIIYRDKLSYHCQASERALPVN